MNFPEMTAAAIGQRLATQDNRITADPIFIVQELVRTWGIEEDYTDKFGWLDEGGEKLSAKEAIKAEKFYEKYTCCPYRVNGRMVVEHPESDLHYSRLQRVGYRDEWTFIQPFLTEAAADWYIHTQPHHHRGKLRTYAASGYPNPEWKYLRAYFQPKWITGLPPVEAVKAHETTRPREDGVRLASVWTHGPGEDHTKVAQREFQTDPQSWGDWLCQHDYNSFGVLPAFHRLKEIGGHVYMALGFCQWVPLADMPWAEKSKWLPATKEGLPI
jgi:hypothetical protein